MLPLRFVLMLALNPIGPDASRPLALAELAR